jgi:hypothetical protein
MDKLRASQSMTQVAIHYLSLVQSVQIMDNLLCHSASLSILTATATSLMLILLVVVGLVVFKNSTATAIT